jgi:hypothetical protein
MDMAQEHSPAFKIGDRVKQPATHPDREYSGFVERVNRDLRTPEYFVRWDRGNASWEIETDLQAGRGHLVKP